MTRLRNGRTVVITGASAAGSRGQSNRLGQPARPPRNLRWLVNRVGDHRQQAGAWHGDWYLARNGYQSQQTNEPDNPDRPDNLWHPVDQDRDFGTHGRFDSRAERRSWQTWLTEHRTAAIVSALRATTICAAKILTR